MKKDLLDRLGKLFKAKDRSIKIYENSITERGNRVYSLIREDGRRKLLVVSRRAPYENSTFDVEESGFFEFDGSDYSYLICPCSGDNLNVLQSEFSWLNPSSIGNRPALGMGDRTGVCKPGQVKVAEECKKHSVLAQQSIREMKHLNRKPKDVVTAAAWAVFQEGYRRRWVADADHLKNEEDIKRCYQAGFSMYTLDPSPHIENIKDYDMDDLREKFREMPWDALNSDCDAFLSRYKGEIKLPNLTLQIDKEDALEAAVRYGKALARVKELSNFIDRLHGESNYDLEVSVDEIEDPTTPIEHFIVASEFKRLGIPVDSLALRFPGIFEKAIDYKGNLKEFEDSYGKHIAIAKTFGHKLSVHSGSDKFSIYPTLGREKEYIHLKTSGTSYLEALRVVARKDPDIFREIVEFARSHFEEDKKGYGSLVSAELEDVPSPKDLSDDELEEIYLDGNEGRQIMHVTYGSVLTAKDENDEYIFRDKLREMLVNEEEDYNREILSHFKDHLEPLGWL